MATKPAPVGSKQTTGNRLPESKQTTGNRLPERVGAAAPPVGGVRGVFVPHKDLRTKAGVQDAVLVARASRMTLIYPNVLRYSRQLFKGKFPRYTYVPDGLGVVLDDEYRALLDMVKDHNADLPPNLQMKVIPWVEMFLNARTDKAEDRLEGAKYEKLPSLKNVLDVDDPKTRELLVQQLVDLAGYDNGSAEGIHIDDHLSYPPDAVPPDQREAYQAKMTRFVKWLIPEFKKRAPGKIFEISTNGLHYATDHTQAHWSEWGADRVIIQLYLPNANSIIGNGDGKNKTYRYTHESGGANVTGIGVTCVANGKDVADEELIKVMKFEAQHNKIVAVWHSGDLLKRRPLITKIADLSRGTAAR